jgi:hypothetical protein
MNLDIGPTGRVLEARVTLSDEGILIEADLDACGSRSTIGISTARECIQ